MRKAPSLRPDLLHALLARLEQRSCLPVAQLDALAGAAPVGETVAGRTAQGKSTASGSPPDETVAGALAHLPACLSCLDAFARLQALREGASPSALHGEVIARSDPARSASPPPLGLVDTPSARALRPTLRRLARRDRGAGAAPSILITGEGGTGKRLVAAAIHELSRRAAGPFVVMACGEL